MGNVQDTISDSTTTDLPVIVTSDDYSPITVNVASKDQIFEYCREIRFHPEYYEVIKELQNVYGRDIINQKNKEGQTVLIVASANSGTTCNEKFVQFLLEQGADPNLPDFDGNTPLMYACARTKTTSTLNTVKLLIRAEAMINLKNKYGETALRFAVRTCGKDSTIETVKMLLEANANPNIKDRDGRTDLIDACDYEKYSSTCEALKLLVKYGADVNAQDNTGLTAIMCLCLNSNNSSNCRILLIHFLLEKGADPNIQNKDGNTALHCLKGHYSLYYNTQINIAKLLIDWNAGVNIKNNQGHMIHHNFVYKPTRLEDKGIKTILDASSIIEKKYYWMKRYDETISEDAGRWINCMICSGSVDVQNPNAFVTKCNHCFHERCVNKWLAQNDYCPMCKRNVYTFK